MSGDPKVREALLAGAREFNSARYFEAHELLEEALDTLPDEVWDLFVGLIQIAVGYHKTTQDLWTGAAGMLERGLAKIAPYPDDVAGLDLDAIRRRAAADLSALQNGTFDQASFRRQPPRLRFR